MRKAATQARRSALTLAAFAATATLLLAGTWLATHQQVAANEAATRAALLAQALPAGSFDNDLAASALPLPRSVAQQLVQRDAAKVYLARQHGQLSGVVLEAAAPNGYGGRIELLVGIARDGTVQGVRVVSHRETPGLGDYIDLAVSPWARQFAGKPADSRWAVKKDGGDTDYISGATISARAVSAAVARCSDYYRSAQARLLQGQP